jgi:guanosine-3',5'-bis(diphosphate) 3'-pyrophosphohydrolase
MSHVPPDGFAMTDAEPRLDEEAAYRVVSYGSFQTGDNDGLHDHGPCDDADSAIRMARFVVDSSLRQDAGAASSAEELARRYPDFGVIPVIWGEPKVTFNPHAHARESAPHIWAEHQAREARREARSREPHWDQARAHQEKVAMVRALAFAAEKHRAQRTSAVDAAPYINRPIELARVLTEEGGVSDGAILCAALLHDTLQGSATTVAELQAEFGPIIAGIVAEVSDDMSLPSVLLRRQVQLERAAGISRRAKVLKLADTIENLRAVLAEPSERWPLKKRQAYFDWSKALIDQLRGVHARLEAIFDETFLQRPEA